MENQLLVSRHKAGIGSARAENHGLLRYAQSIIADTAVQVGSLINGVCTEDGDKVPPESHSIVTIRFSWTASPDSGDRYGLMSIALSPDDGFVRVNAAPLPADEQNILLENKVSLRELTTQKLGQTLMDTYTQMVKRLTPAVCQMAECDSSAEPEDSIWTRIRSLAVAQPAELAIQS